MVWPKRWARCLSNVELRTSVLGTKYQLMFVHSGRLRDDIEHPLDSYLREQPDPAAARATSES